MNDRNRLFPDRITGLRFCAVVFVSALVVSASETLAGGPDSIAVTMVDDFDGEDFSGQPLGINNLFGPRSLVPGCGGSIAIAANTFDGKALTFNYNHVGCDSGWRSLLGGADPARGRDLSDAISLRFQVRRDATSTTRAYVQLSDTAGGSAIVILPGISETWTEWNLSLPASFPGVDMTSLAELSFVVSQVLSDDPDGVGVLYFDEIYFASAAVEPSDDAGFLSEVARRSFRYFWDTANTTTGLAPDRASNESIASIAGVGYQLSSLPIGVDRGWVTRGEAALRTRLILETLHDAPQRPVGAVADEDVYSGHKGLFYHFLHSSTGLRAWSSELSTIDTALFFLGVIDVLVYFDDVLDADEIAIRADAQAILDRAEWSFVHDAGPNQIRSAWSPESGFVGWWDVYTDEAIIISLVAASTGMAPRPPADLFHGWLREQRNVNGYSAYTSWTGAQFTLTQALGWFDFTGRTDLHPETPVNWRQNAWTGARAAREYAISLSGAFPTFGSDAWGMSDSSTPGSAYQGVLSQPRLSPDTDLHNGTLPPSGAAAAVPLFDCDPDGNLAIDALRHYYEDHDDAAGLPRLWKVYGFVDAFNEFVSPAWYANEVIGLAQGATLLSIENHLSDNPVANRVASYPDLQVTLDQLFLPQWHIDHIHYAREAEQFETSIGGGIAIESHTNASADTTVQIGDVPGNAVEYAIRNAWLPGETYSLGVRYSDDVAGNIILVRWDGVDIDFFTTVDTGGWNTFVESPRIEIGEIAAGDHTLRLIGFNGGTFGVNVDAVRIYSAYARGDLNEDQLVTPDDIPLFADVLAGAVTDASLVARADMNGDKLANGLDVQPFVERLLGP